MNQTSVYIVEDSAMTRAALIDMLEVEGFHIAGSSVRADQAWSEIMSSQVDLVLLDINLAGPKNGIWLAQQINEKLDIPFIYLTAYSDSATVQEVMKTKPYGYLTKPYNEVSLLATIKIALENFVTSKNNKIESKTTVYIKNNYHVEKISTAEILYVQSDKNYLTIFLTNRKIVIRSKISDFFEKLPDDIFLQVHQRYLVNKNAANKVSNEYILIADNKIPISRAYKKEVKNAFDF